jgi:hypothetical protein
METLVQLALLPQVLLLASIGFIAFFSSCTLGLRAGWLAYNPVICGVLGALAGGGMGIAAAMI